MATPGFLRLAFIASIVTSTTAASIWLLIMAAMLGGPPMRRMVSGSIFCSLKNPRSMATKYGSDDAVGNTPTLTLSCATACCPKANMRAAISANPEVFNPVVCMVWSRSLSWGKGWAVMNPVYPEWWLERAYIFAEQEGACRGTRVAALPRVRNNARAGQEISHSYRHSATVYQKLPC